MVCGCLKQGRWKEDLGKGVRGQEAVQDVKRQEAMLRDRDQEIKTVEEMWFSHKLSR